MRSADRLVVWKYKHLIGSDLKHSLCGRTSLKRSCCDLSLASAFDGGPAVTDPAMAWESIKHRTLPVNGINMHIAEKGEGPVVLLLHGFPELWYSWRHQIVGLADLGYHAVAPDLRGYGDTTAPTAVTSYTIFNLVGDVVALIDALGQEQVFVVGHDWGAIIAWYLCMFRPERVKALVNLSVAFMPWIQRVNLIEYFRELYGDAYYTSRFQEPGAVEEEFARAGTQLCLKMILTNRNPGPLMLHKTDGPGPLGPPDIQIPLPSWLSEEDVNYFASKFEKSGFTGGINYYRSLPLNYELTAPWAKVQIKVPTKFIVGDLDLTYHYPGVQDYIHKGGFMEDVPFLQEVVVMEGVAHFINQEKPNEITKHVYDFIKRF